MSHVHSTKRMETCITATYVHIHTGTHADTHTFMETMHTCMDEHAHCTRTCRRTHVHIHTHVHVCIYTVLYWISKKISVSKSGPTEFKPVVQGSTVCDILEKTQLWR